MFFIFTKYRILHFYKIPLSQPAITKYIQPAIGPKTTASSPPDRPASPAGPANPAGPASPRSLLLTLFCIFAKYPWPASPDRPPNWVFIIFTKYRILHFYKIPLHRPADRGQLPLRTQTQPASQTSQPSRPSQSRQAASLDILYFYKIPYFTFLQNTVFYIFTKYSSTGQRTGDHCGPSPAQSASQQAQLV